MYTTQKRVDFNKHRVVPLDIESTLTLQIPMANGRYSVSDVGIYYNEFNVQDDNFMGFEPQKSYKFVKTKEYGRMDLAPS